MKPYSELDEKTTNIILGLVEKCISLDLGNVSFEHYPTTGHNDLEKFSLSELKTGWELVVSAERFSTRDIYKIVDGKAIHNYSEPNIPQTFGERW